MIARLAAALFALALGCTARAEQGRTLALAPCHPRGFGRDALCGALKVPEDRTGQAGKAGRTIDLHVIVLPALSRDADKDPLFLLAGGPGQAASKAFPQLVPVFEPLRKTRDLVLVDQRGTGESRALECKLTKKGASLRERLEARMEAAALTSCAAALDADPRFYTTPNAADDLDDVRQALGYARINLWGGSYGTRLALVYARQHPERLRAMVLDGVAPLSLRLPLTFARDGQRALDLLLKACASDADCEGRFPKLGDKLKSILERLGDKPEEVTAADPLTGKPITLSLTRRMLADYLRGFLYSPDLTALLPLTIEEASQGRWAPFLAQVDAFGANAEGSIALGLMLSVICAEDAPSIAADELDRFSADTFLGPATAREFLDACKAWPHGSAPAGFRAPIRSDAPALLLSGELDPVTPPSWAEEALKTLPHGRHVVLPGVGHGATLVGCAPELVHDFIVAGSADKLDATCAGKLKRPPFFLSFAGPKP